MDTPRHRVISSKIHRRADVLHGQYLYYGSSAYNYRLVDAMERTQTSKLAEKLPASVRVICRYDM